MLPADAPFVCDTDPTAEAVAKLLTEGTVVNVAHPYGEDSPSAELEITYADGTLLRVAAVEGHEWDEYTSDPAYLGYTICTPKAATK